MRIAIVAPGGVGGTFGGRLAKAGAEVVALARGAHLAATALAAQAAPKTKVRGGQLCSASSCGMADERIVNLADSGRLLVARYGRGYSPSSGRATGSGLRREKARTRASFDRRSILSGRGCEGVEASPVALNLQR